MENSKSRNPLTEPLAQLARCLDRHVRAGDRLLVGLSGGLDSVLLLHGLHQLAPRYPFTLSALHVHHGLSPHADHWQQFCEALCARLAVPLQTRRVVVERHSQQGLEAAARKARYEVFAQVSAEFLLLAHHQNDQVETLLLNLLRGSGVTGAAAMPVRRAFASGSPLQVLRPWLGCSRQSILQAAEQAGLEWIEDESNEDPVHARNFLRHRVIPLLQSRYPACLETLSRAAGHFADAHDLLEELAREDAAKIMVDGQLLASRLATLDERRACNVLRFFLRWNGVPAPDQSQLREIRRQLCQARADRQVLLELGSQQIFRYRDRIWLACAAEVPTGLQWQGETCMRWGSGTLHFTRAQGQGIDQRKLQQAPVWLKPRQGGEHLRPDPRRPRRSLKKWFQELAVPPWSRSRMPLLWCADQLVWVPGVGIEADWQCAADAQGVLPRLVDFPLGQARGEGEQLGSE